MSSESKSKDSLDEKIIRGVITSKVAILDAVATQLPNAVRSYAAEVTKSDKAAEADQRFEAGCRRSHARAESVADAAVRVVRFVKGKD